MRVGTRLLALVAGATLTAACLPAAVPSRRGVYPAYRLRPVEEVRDAFTATLERPLSDLDWIEVTLLDPIVVEREADDFARLGGLPQTDAAARKAELLRESTVGRTVFEAWLSTTCADCRDLRGWTFLLARPDGEVLRARWVTSEVVHTEAETLQVLDASRAVERAWVRGRLVFDPEVAPSRGTLRLLARRPEGWTRPLELVWRFAATERVWAPMAFLAALPEWLTP